MQGCRRLFSVSPGCPSFQAGRGCRLGDWSGRYRASRVLAAHCPALSTASSCHCYQMAKSGHACFGPDRHGFVSSRTISSVVPLISTLPSRNIGAVHDLKRFAHVVIGDQYPDPRDFRSFTRCGFPHRNQVYPAKGSASSRYFGSAADSAQLARRRSPPDRASAVRRGGDGKFGQQFLKRSRRLWRSVTAFPAARMLSRPTGRGDSCGR